MRNKIFVDTNILVYGYIQQDNVKQQTIKHLFEKNLGKAFFVSVQVINEFYSALTKNNIEHNKI